jgi:hypothetical protein
MQQPSESTDGLLTVKVLQAAPAVFGLLLGSAGCGEACPVGPDGIARYCVSLQALADVDRTCERRWRSEFRCLRDSSPDLPT